MSKSDDNGTLYTVCVIDKPVAVMCVGAERLLEDSPATDAEIVRAKHTAQNLQNRSRSEACDLSEHQKIYEALESHLGSDLMATGLWNGDIEDVRIRNSRPEEVAAWTASYNDAVQAGEQEAGDPDWLIVLA